MSRATWLRRISAYTTALTMAGFGMTGIASADTITNTGPGSQNHIHTQVTNSCQTTNNNTVSVTNQSSQWATSGNAGESANTDTSVSWSGWAALNPTTAQTQGISYSAWHDHVAQWISQRASGTGWNSNNTNLSSTPSGSSWSSYNPMTWQANDQTFSNWYAGVESYLDAEGPTLLLSWPADATGDWGGSSTGNAINTNSANFSITINNAAHAAAAMPTICGGVTGSSTPPPTGGMGGGAGSSSTAQYASTAISGPHGISGGGSGSGNASGRYITAVAQSSPAPHTVTASAQAPTAVNTPPTGGMGGGPTPSSSNSISNTGPGSSNSISSSTNNYSSLTNNTSISVVNVSTQTAATGNTNSSYNTSTANGGSGNAGNTNGSGVSADLSS